MAQGRANNGRGRYGRQQEFNPKLSRSRIAWLAGINGNVVLHAPEQSEGSERGTSYLLFFPNKYGRDVHLDLTNMTEEELGWFKQLIELAYERALPTVRLRDKAAKDALANGDDSDPRVYRLPARFIVRKGTVGENDPGVLDRSEDLSDLDGEVQSPYERVREPSEQVAPGEPSDDGS